MVAEIMGEFHSAIDFNLWLCLHCATFIIWWKEFFSDNRRK